MALRCPTLQKLLFYTFNFILSLSIITRGIIFVSEYRTIRTEIKYDSFNKFSYLINLLFPYNLQCGSWSFYIGFMLLAVVSQQSFFFSFWNAKVHKNYIHIAPPYNWWLDPTPKSVIPIIYVSFIFINSFRSSEPVWEDFIVPVATFYCPTNWDGRRSFCCLCEEDTQHLTQA